MTSEIVAMENRIHLRINSSGKYTDKGNEILKRHQGSWPREHLFIWDQFHQQIHWCGKKYINKLGLQLKILFFEHMITVFNNQCIVDSWNESIFAPRKNNIKKFKKKNYL